MLKEILIVGTGHHDVDVIIPGDEALMADGTEKGASTEGVTEVVLLAEVGKDIEHAELEGTLLRGGDGDHRLF